MTWQIFLSTENVFKNKCESHTKLGTLAKNVPLSNTAEAYLEIPLKEATWDLGSQHAKLCST